VEHCFIFVEVLALEKGQEKEHSVKASVSLKFVVALLLTWMPKCKLNLCRTAEMKRALWGT
jgi:hypothetical protein